MAQVVGTGEGKINGRTLNGTAATQIILAQVPGVDAAFSFLPRAYGPRLESSSKTTLNDDGSVLIEIDNKPAAGEEYLATHTTLRGARIKPNR